MQLKGINNTGGAEPPLLTCELYNRTGAALAEGDIVALNLDGAVSTAKGLNPRTLDDTTDWVFGTGHAVTTANRIGACLVFMRGADGSASCADNAKGVFAMQGVVYVKQNGANFGEFLGGTNGQVYATPLTLAELEAQTTNSQRNFGICLEASTGVQLKRALWDCWGNFGPSGGGDT